MKHALVAVVVVAAVAVGGGACPKTSAPVDAGASGEKLKNDLKANFDATTKPDARAVAVCAALFDAPSQKKDECCHAQPSPGPTPLGKNCAGILSAALADKDLVYDDAKAQACIADRAQQLGGCGWVTPSLPAA